MSTLNHYVSKYDITWSIIEGIEVPALCGEMVLCVHQGGRAVPGQEVAADGAKTCPDCEQVYNSLAVGAKEKIPETV